ncbi:MAG: anthranilate phosphoribosyltransferase [Planctomycetota bacterium]
MPFDPKPALALLARGEDLDETAAEACVEALLSGALDASAAGALLMGLRRKGEATTELAGFARALRRRASPFPAADPDAVDTCGTGGDGRSTMNLSTAAAFVAAAAGVRVLKHGNRSFTSRCGSADVLSALGIDPGAAPDRWAGAYRETGFAFLLAPLYHPAMKAAAPIRSALGFRTIFNLVGPLANPALVRRQVLGVADPVFVPRVAEALRSLGAVRAIVLHGEGGYDEATPAGPVSLAILGDGVIRREAIDPAALGLPPCDPAALAIQDPAEGARAIEAVFAGSRGARRDAVLLNAALAMRVAPDPSPDFASGLRRAAAAIDDGRARALLDRLRILVPAPATAGRG